MFNKMKAFMNEKAEKVERAFAPVMVAGAAMGIVPTVYDSLHLGRTEEGPQVWRGGIAGTQRTG